MIALGGRERQLDDESRDTDRRRLALHEAGHAVAHLLFGAVEVSATLNPPRTTARARHSREEKIIVLLSGEVAVELAEPDRRDVARAIACFDRRDALALLEPGESLVEDWIPRAREFGRTHLPAIVRVATALRARGSLTDAEIRALI